MIDDDRQLLIRTRDGHEPAARLLWERQAPRLTAYARSIVRRGVSPEDIVQSVFCKVVALDRAVVRSVQDVAPWLTTLVRREALDALRAARRERSRLARLTPRGAGSSGPRVPVSAHVPGDSRALHAALDALPRRHREIVTLKHIAGLTFDQIALALSLNRNTAAARYRSAIGSLRAALSVPAVPSHTRPAAEVLHG